MLMFTEMFITYQSWIATFTGGNEFAIGMVNVWALTVMAFILRSVPTSIYYCCKRQFTTTLTMNNGGYYEKETIINFMKWIMPKVNSKWSRTLSVDSHYDAAKTATTGLGYGIHFFWWKKRLFWIHKSKLDSSGSERQKEEISISTFGRSHAPFNDMIEEFTPKQHDDEIRIFQLSNNGEWEYYTSTIKRPLCSVAMNKEIKNKIIDEIEHFRNNRDWFFKKGLPHKLTLLFDGKPGSGKSSLLKSIASEWSMNLCIINMKYVTDKTLERGLATAPKNSLIVMEDFDSNPATKNRMTMIESNDDEMIMGLTLSGFLNALDGVNPIDNCIVGMTTNVLEHVDAAIYRKGRVDHIFEINEIDGVEVKEYANYVYPDYDFSGLTFKSCLGCMLNEALLYSKDDPEKFIESLHSNGAIEYDTNVKLLVDQHTKFVYND